MDCGASVTVESVPSAHFSNLTRLIVMSVEHDSHCQCIGNISTLNYLKIGNSISFKSFKYIIQGNLINLHTLKCGSCSITDNHVILFKNHNLPNITKLNLRCNRFLTSRAFIIMSRVRFEKLRKLEMTDCASHEEVITLLKGLNSLTELTIVENQSKRDFTLSNPVLDDIPKVQAVCKELNKKLRFFPQRESLK